MSEARLSVIGLYNYGQLKNDNLFSNLSLPSGVDKDAVIDTILEQCAEFEVLFADYDYMKFSIGLWSKRWYRTFEKWINALSIEYEPLWNYDRTEIVNDGESENIYHHKFNKGTDDVITNATGKSDTTGHTDTVDTVDETDTNSVVAYNSDTLHLKEQDVIDRDGTSTTDDTINSNATTNETKNENTTLNETDDMERGKSFNHNARMYGNIGVTTSQQMLEAELEIARFNLIQQIVDCFKVDMCILVY